MVQSAVGRPPPPRPAHTIEAEIPSHTAFTGTLAQDYSR